MKRSGHKKTVDIKKEISSVLEIPEEVVFDMPFISLKGREEAVVENYKGIIEYSSERIRLNTTSGVFKLSGEGLTIKCLDADNVIISGKINSAEFI